MRDDLRAPSGANDTRPQRFERNACRKILRLRVLATTDIHMQFLGYDYIRDAPLAHHGLAGLATLVDEARAEALADDAACVLFDNGDLLQGTALGDTLSRQPVSKTHAVVRCLDAIGYDAVGLGNHDLDHGFEYPSDISALSNASLISSNLRCSGQAALHPTAMIPCTSIDQINQQPVELRIGVMSVLPEQTPLWNKSPLLDSAQVTSTRDAVAQTALHLRQQGADVVILLAHLGILETDSNRDDARRLAADPSIDAMITGHTHLRLPGKDHHGFEDVDAITGSIGNCPAIMPGFEASDLGVLDLELGQSEHGHWGVVDHRAQLRPNTAAIPPHPEIMAICAKAHAQTRQDLAQEVGQTHLSLHNFFSLAMPTATCAIVASAKRFVVQEGLHGLPEADLPILATASAHTAGGRSGPSHFLHIPPGPILRRHLAGLNPYANQICALRVTGADLRYWLEHVSKVFCQLIPGDQEQNLKHAHKPAYDFDTIFGIDYAIDPTLGFGNRITQLRYEGRPVEADQKFVLATNQFRAAGGGGGAQLQNRQITLQSHLSVSSALQDVFEAPDRGHWQHTQPWRFSCSTPVPATLHTTPEAQFHLDDIAQLSPEPLGIDGDGFARIRLSL